MTERSYTGGARIGWIHASWPFAKLKIGTNKLELASLGSYEFNPSQVVSLEPYGSIPLLANGISINHNRTDYPEKIIFWCIGNRDRVLEELKQNGFLPTGRPIERSPEFPIRWSIVIAVIALWNVLLMLEVFTLRNSHGPGLPSLLAILLLFSLATAVRVSSRIQGLVLRRGHQMGEIKSFVGLLQLVSGILSLGFGATWLAHAYAG